jgi:hypothetical protein
VAILFQDDSETQRNGRLCIIGDRAEHMQHKPAGRARSVDALAQRHESDADGLQLIEQQDQVPQIAAQPIEPPAHQDVEPASFGIGDELIERGSSILCPAYTAVDVLDGGPAPRLDVASEFSKLILGILIGRTDASVNGTAHEKPPWVEGLP